MMTETLLALLIAHLLADFIFQTDAMVRRKHAPAIFALHIAIVFVLSLAALGGTPEAALAVTAAHLIIDALKTWALPETLRDTLPAFLVDQLAHVGSIIAVAVIWPNAIETGLWAMYATLLMPHILVLCAAIVAIFVGGHVVGLLMASYAAQLEQSKGLSNAGRMIGQLERALIFLFLLMGETAAVGFLIAAKSVLRFDTAAQGQKEGEYVIIGTLASFGWAIAVGFATQGLLEFVPQSP